MVFGLIREQPRSSAVKRCCGSLVQLRETEATIAATIQQFDNWGV